MLSPGAMPVVSSYTWMMALSPASLMVSPTRRTSPTRTSSSIMASVTPAGFDDGPVDPPHLPYDSFVHKPS